MRRVVLTLLALAVFLPSVAFARTHLACDVDRIVREACCCPPKQAKQPIPSAPWTTMQRECCKIEKHAAAPVPVATEATSQPVPAPVAVIVAVTTITAPVRDERVTVRPRAQAPPPERSLLSQHSALLL